MSKLLVIDEDPDHAEYLVTQLRSRHEVCLCGNIASAIREIKNCSSLWEVVIVNVSDRSRAWCSILKELQEVSGFGFSASAPLFLCVTTSETEPQFAIQIEQSGGRLVHEE